MPCKLISISSIVNVVLLYPGLAERGLIDLIFTKIPAAQLAQVHQLAERVIDLGTCWIAYMIRHSNFIMK